MKVVITKIEARNPDDFTYVGNIDWELGDELVGLSFEELGYAEDDVRSGLREQIQNAIDQLEEEISEI